MAMDTLANIKEANRADTPAIVVFNKIDLVKEGGKYVLRPRTLRAADLAGILGKSPSGQGLTIGEMDEALGKALGEDDERIRAGH